MRIAVVHSFYSDRQPSGENLVVDQQVRALRSLGHEVSLVSRRTDGVRAEETGYHLRSAARVALGSGWNPLFALRDAAPDVVHVHNTFPNMGTNWMRKVESPIVLTVHNHRFECAAATLFRDGRACEDCRRVPVLPGIVHGCYKGSLQSVAPALATAPKVGTYDRAFAAADMIICLNEVARDHIARRVTEPGKIAILPNFPAELQLGVGPGSGGVDALCVGRLSTEKGILRLVQEWPAGRRLTIVGDGPQAAEVRALAESRPEIDFLGQVPVEEVHRLMRDARVVVVPSVCYEGFPTVALEAMQMSVPLVLSGHIAVAQTLESLGVGAVFDFDDAHRSLVGALARVAADESRYGDRSRQAFERHYSKDAWLRGIAQVYAGALRRRSGRR